MRRLGLIAAVLAGPVTAQDLPPLPAGLDGLTAAPGTSAPPLPAGLDGASTPAPALPEGLDGSGLGTPALPAGLAGLDTAPSTSAPPLPTGLEGASEALVMPPPMPSAMDDAVSFTGFVELRHARRLETDPLQDAPLLSEARLHLELQGRDVPFRFAADLVADAVDETSDGEKAFDLREANILLRPTSSLDIRLGRQILTWGTGDLVFINDVFPKDYVSFFAGRSDDYLKAPSDAVRIGWFTEALNFDLVIMAADNVDRGVDGERLSYTDRGTGAPSAVTGPTTRPDGPEYALRAYRTLGAYEVAGYAYKGHWKSPAADGTYPALSVYGASLRGPLAGGIASAEFGVYDSRDDADGTRFGIPNSDRRILLGFEREIASETTLGLQYYAARMQDHDAYLASAAPGAVIDDETRDLVTLRLTRLMMNQTLTASAFAFYSPTQEDSYLRLNLSYKPSDAVTLDLTLGRFAGDAATPFGQFDLASGAGVGLRYSF